MNFDNTFKRVEMLFRFGGIYIRSVPFKTSDRIKARCIYIFNFILANHELFGSILWCIDDIRKGANFLSLMYTAPCLTISVLAQFKGFFLIKNEKSAQQLINILKPLVENEDERKQSFEKDKIIKEETKFLNFVLNTLNVFYAALVCGFSLSPLVFIAVKYYQTKEIVLTLPFLVLYEFDPFKLKFWPIAFFAQCWSEFVVCLNICSADYFFFVCCTYIRIQFRLLQHDFENAIPAEEDSNEQFVENDEFRNSLKALIERHQELIESANILEVIYSKSTLFNFLSSSLIICLTGFNVTTVNDVADMLNFITFLAMSLLQVFFVCLFADLLMTSSMDISDAIYNCKWYKAKPKIGNKLLIILKRSQKPCKVTASGFADVTLQSFMRVLSTAWSYFALLQSMYGD